MFKSLALSVLVLAASAAHAGFAADAYYSGAYFKAMSTKCPTVKMSKVLANYQSRVEAAKGQVVPLTKKEREAADAFDDACKAAMNKQIKK